MANSYIYALTDTWTDGNTQYNAVSMAVTATNSHSNSMLLRFLYNNTVVYSIRRDGLMTLSGNAALGNTIVSGTLTVNTVTAPTTSSSNGVAGELRWDSSYVYVCVANNTWKRSALTTW